MTHAVHGLVIFCAAAFCEIAGCFAFWAWLRLGASPWWIVPGLGALALFAYLLTLADSAFAGRTYAAYGGIYIAMALGCLCLTEGVRPDRWDLIGAGLCLLGAAVIIAAPRGAG